MTSALHKHFTHSIKDHDKAIVGVQTRHPSCLAFLPEPCSRDVERPCRGGHWYQVVGVEFHARE
ncbi:MAG: hypothetical protein IPK83_18580 [Planctomycetes bacterium]|nr:hypothetical protein [Planctomycetota bacterium]